MELRREGTEKSGPPSITQQLAHEADRRWATTKPIEMLAGRSKKRKTKRSRWEPPTARALPPPQTGKNSYARQTPHQNRSRAHAHDGNQLTITPQRFVGVLPGTCALQPLNPREHGGGNR
jgi:hypothetical protein